jgi:hypothetical protein
MFCKGHICLLSLASVFALTFCAATTCHASLMAPAPLDFSEEHLLATAEGGMSAEQNEILPAQDSRPPDAPQNPLRLTARKGLVPTGPYSSSSSSSSSTGFGSGGLLPCAIVDDPGSVLDAEQSVWFATVSDHFVPCAIQIRLFRPPRLA